MFFPPEVSERSGKDREESFDLLVFIFNFDASLGGTLEHMCVASVILLKQLH